VSDKLQRKAPLRIVLECFPSHLQGILGVESWYIVVRRITMDWNSLISAVIGGLLAVIPVLITIRNQSKERDKDRQEQRMDAKTQLALELISNDVKIFEDFIDNSLREMSIIVEFSLKRWDKKLSVQEMKEQIKSAYFEETGRIYKLGDADIGAEKIARTLGTEIYSEYKNFNDLLTPYYTLVVNDVSVWDTKRKEEDELYEKVMNSAAKLHSLLRGKIISIRE
jgi:hypothetical protein